MRLIVVDDDRLVVDSLKIILGAQPQIEVVGTGADGNDAVALYAEHAPDIALLDIQMPGRDGLSAAREILERDPAARVVFLTTFSDDEYIVSALKLGARGYLIKTDVAAIPPALAQVMDGKRVLEGKAIEDINFDGAGIEGGTPRRPAAFASLTDREFEVAELIARGLDNKEIAATAYMGEGTVRNHISSILAKAGNINHPYLQENGSTKKGIITISSNRGLAGGYNNNIVKLIRDSGMNKEDIMIYAVGHKAMDTLKHRGYEIVSDDSEMINEPVYDDARILGEKLLKAFEDGEIGEIYLAYTDFKNTVVHEPKLVKLLPIENDQQANEEKSESKAPMNFEPEPEEALSLLIPKYICSMIYGALVTSVASENGARMQAMDSATSNAEEMISNLELAYNRARQGAITQELTEIISGAEALK